MLLSLLTKRISPNRVLTWILVVSCFALFYCGLNRSALPAKKSNNNHQKVHTFRQQNATKSILIWNGVRRVEVYIFGKGNNAFVKQNCLYTRCEIVHDRSKRPLEDYDAIVVVFNDQFTTADQLMMPVFKNKRNGNQRVVFFTQEAPPALKPYYNMSQLGNIFNWTMTYRMDADIPLIYGRVIPKENAPQTPAEVDFYRERASTMYKSKFNKTKTIAWMVDHCDTDGQREKYIAELSKYIDVEIIGKCGPGNMSCPRHGLHSSAPHCYNMLESIFKFYLSFENAICPDYVTEKFFKIMGHDIVPIVYGGANYRQHAPPHSYIDARQFKPKELADYLKRLNANDALYNEYFWWKDFYRVEYTLNDRSRHAFCDLCQRLHESEDDAFQSYPDMESEWGDNKCTPFDPKWIS